MCLQIPQRCLQKVMLNLCVHGCGLDLVTYFQNRMWQKWLSFLRLGHRRHCSFFVLFLSWITYAHEEKLRLPANNQPHMWEPPGKWVFPPQSSLMTTALLNILPMTSWETPRQLPSPVTCTFLTHRIYVR